MRFTKDDPALCELRSHLSDCLYNARIDKNLSQMEFAAELHIDRRSYLDIEHRKNLCCTLSLLFFLIYHCKDVQGFVDSCKPIFDKYFFNPDTPCD